VSRLCPPSPIFPLRTVTFPHCDIFFLPLFFFLLTTFSRFFEDRLPRALLSHFVSTARFSYRLSTPSGFLIVLCCVSLLIYIPLGFKSLLSYTDLALSWVPFPLFFFSNCFDALSPRSFSSLFLVFQCIGKVNPPTFFPPSTPTRGHLLVHQTFPPLFSPFHLTTLSFFITSRVSFTRNGCLFFF